MRTESVTLNWPLEQSKFGTLLRSISTHTDECYVVGGAVRDRIISQQATKAEDLANLADLDLILPRDACRIARSAADQVGWAYYPLDAKRDIARLVHQHKGKVLVCDVARFQGPDLPSDLRARDFTMNALAFRIETEAQYGLLIDHHNGLADVEQKLIRRITPQSLLQDPARLLRAVRLSAQLDFAIERETRAQIQDQSRLLHQISPERIRDELWKALATQRPAHVLDQLKHLGLLVEVMPEVNQFQGSTPPSDEFAHTFWSVGSAGILRNWLRQDNIHSHPIQGDEAFQDAFCLSLSHLQERLSPWREPLLKQLDTHLSSHRHRIDWLVWMALLHEVGKQHPQGAEADERCGARDHTFDSAGVNSRLAQERLKHLRFSALEVKLVTKAIIGCTRFQRLNHEFKGRDLSRKACFRFYRDTGTIRGNSLIGLDAILLALGVRLADFSCATQVQPAELSSEAWRDYTGHAIQLLRYGLVGTGIPGVTSPPLVDGNLLLERLPLVPGPLLGELLAAAAEAEASDQFQDADAAVTWCARWLERRQSIKSSYEK